MNGEEFAYKLYLSVQKHNGNLHIGLAELLDTYDDEEFRDAFDSAFVISDIFHSRLLARLKNNPTSAMSALRVDMHYVDRVWHRFIGGRIIVNFKDDISFSDNGTVFLLDYSFAVIRIEDMLIFKDINGLLFALRSSNEQGPK